MLQKITELWPNLLTGKSVNDSDQDDSSLDEPQPLPQNEDPIEETFKGLKWTRVIDLRDYKDASGQTFKMIDDIKQCHEDMLAVKLEGLPRLITHFDPITW